MRIIRFVCGEMRDWKSYSTCARPCQTGERGAEIDAHDELPVFEGEATEVVHVDSIHPNLG